MLQRRRGSAPDGVDDGVAALKSPSRDVSDEIIRLAIESSPIGKIIVDADGRIVLVNGEVERMFGYPRAELLGRSIDMLVPAAIRPMHGALRASFVERPETRRMGAGRDLYGLRKDQSEIPIEIGLNPIRTRDGLMVLAAIADITERRMAEDKFRLAVEACPSAMIMTDAGGRIVLVNAEAERLFGYLRHDLLGQSIDILVPESVRSLHGAHRAGFAARPEVRRMGEGRDLYGVRKDGARIPVEIGLNPIRTRDGLMVLAAIADISERKASEERLRLVVEASPIGNIMTDAAGRIVLVNAEAERLFGYRRDELIGQSIDILVPASTRPVHDQHRAGFAAHPEARRMGEGRDLYGLRKDGREIPVEVALNPIHTAEGPMVLTAITDISERKSAEQAIARRGEELQRSNADLEQFAYVASHDLQEPLRMVASYTELLAERYKGQLDARADKYIGYAVDGAKRMQQLIRDLLAFSRVGTQGAGFKSTDSDLVVRDVLAGLKVAIDESRAEIVCADLPAVRADEGQLRQLFQNLIGNALKFRAERRPHISIGARHKSGEWIFHVADNGIGIEKQYSERIFQMFQRLHERGRYDGNGIGLAIAKKIVERHGGRIWFESESTTGTTFFFSMPDTPGDLP